MPGLRRRRAIGRKLQRRHGDKCYLPHAGSDARHQVTPQALTTIGPMVSLARAVASPGRRGRRSRVWLLAGLLAGSGVALVDAFRHHEVLLTGVLIAPLIAAVGASTIEVGIVGIYAVALALLLGEINDIFFTSD